MSDPDWILVGLDGEYGFAPANYIEVGDDAPAPAPAPAAAATPTTPPPVQAPPITERALPPRPPVEEEEEEEEEVSAPASPATPPPNPAAALAGVMQSKNTAPPVLALPPRPQYTPEESDEEEPLSPALPVRPRSQVTPVARQPSPRSPISPGVVASPPHNRVSFRGTDEIASQSPGGFHLYNINEMVSVMGKRKKMPTTLGINIATGTIMIAPEKARDGPQQEWSAEKMTHYSLEGKHVFIELIRPTKSVDFHAGAKDTAHEIVSALGELAGAIRAEGLREVIAAGSGTGQKKGQVLYDFMAQGDDEVTVGVGDDVIILDDTKSEEWWQVRRLKTGKEGVVPSSYIEITGVVNTPSSSGINAGRSTVEQNRLEEQRLAKDSLRIAREEDARGSEVGPGMKLPERGSSLTARDNGNQIPKQHSRRESSKADGSSRSTKSSKYFFHARGKKLTIAEPDPSKVRTWTDRSKSFSVEAQFLALKDGKINLHKMNGVKIAVPVVKMSVEDLEYVERVTGVSLDEDKPLSDIKRQRSRAARDNSSSAPTSKAGASIEQPQKPEYDWFQFFLSCGVAVGLCERYAQVFNRDSMDETVLPDVDASVLRTLGIREGDIIKIMRTLDAKYDRKGDKNKRNVSFGSSEVMGNGDDAEGGLFSGAGGALRNNTRKSRPAPAVQTNDVVDAKAFAQGENGEAAKKPAADAVSTPLTSAPATARGTAGGFDDDAWDVKPAKQQPPASTPSAAAPPAAQPTPAAPPPQQPALTGSMQDLSFLSTPLEPVKAQPTAPPPPPAIQTAPPAPVQVQQPTGATPSFFAGVAQQATGIQPQQTGIPLGTPQGFNMSQPSFAQQQQQQNIARQRPVAPQFAQGQGSLMPPPPARPLSAPQTQQQSAFGPPPPLQPQMTGFQNSGGFQQPSIAPPGQSLNDLRMQQQYTQQQGQVPGFGGQPVNLMPQSTGMNQFNNGVQQNGFGQPLQPQQTGFTQSQPFMNSQPTGSPFADPRMSQQFAPVQQQPTGFQNSFAPQQYPQATGVNSFLPPALQPQQTGALQPQQTGMNGFGQPPAATMPQQAPMAPLIPQKTGPPPPVRFGVTGDTKKLMPQATGRRANLAQASKFTFHSFKYNRLTIRSPPESFWLLTWRMRSVSLVSVVILYDRHSRALRSHNLRTLFSLYLSSIPASWKGLLFSYFVSWLLCNEVCRTGLAVSTSMAGRTCCALSEATKHFE
jgi:hypothetical protein